jgi:hypothetical protein
MMMIIDGDEDGKLGECVLIMFSKLVETLQELLWLARC